jgi:L-aminopeptidase/D-esterase-like protein
VTSASAQNLDTARGLTAVDGIKVGHHTLSERPTGCTVVLVEAGVTGGVDVRGAAPGTRETDLLDPLSTVEQVHAIVLSGGSAFGLSVADGVMRYLSEKNIGYPMRVPVPIVPAAILYDLGVGDNPNVRPTAECGYVAASQATSGPIPEGSVGAGAGATIGKIGGRERAMKGGIGTAAIALPNGLVVAALVAVNAVGDVIDPSTGTIVAGVRSLDGTLLADARTVLRDPAQVLTRDGESTTIGVVATNARLTKAQAGHLARMAHDGLARAVRPAHTPMDGDTIFSLATGTWSGDGSLLTIGSLAADAMAEAIVRAARMATGVPGFPATRDLPNR